MALSKAMLVQVPTISGESILSVGAVISAGGQIATVILYRRAVFKHLVGNGWSIPVVEHMLAQLRDLFADDMLSPYPKYTYTHPWEPYKSLSTNI